MKEKKPEKWGFIKTFFAGFIFCGAGIDILNLLFSGITDWALNQLLVKAVGSAMASILSMVVKPILRALFQTQGETTMGKIFKKIAAFFKRVGQWLNANKKTFGGIISSAISGTIGTAVCVCGYTFDIMPIVEKIESLAWVAQLQVHGFNLTPLITGIIIWLFTIWNGVAAVHKGWESPEAYKERIEAEKNSTIVKVSSEELHKQRVEEEKKRLMGE